ncbi:hypothetical protein C2G38_2175285 [Gigaspora rosea]|uniref:Uncharacterized protein n=1 Tax=Gigaspora rosea TaxID=44941 RepID=A0A397VS46_9GLOM|nr:hypothetical protein C2G38_2175285 [Gigaspora rosea]
MWNLKQQHTFFRPPFELDDNDKLGPDTGILRSEDTVKGIQMLKSPTAIVTEAVTKKLAKSRLGSGINTNFNILINIKKSRIDAQLQMHDKTS